MKSRTSLHERILTILFSAFTIVIISSQFPLISFAAIVVPAAPRELIAQRTRILLTDLKRRPPLPRGEKNAEIDSFPEKSQWLDVVYRNNLVDASVATELLADKRLFYEVLFRELGETEARHYYPKTLGLREFLFAHGLIAANGNIINDSDRIEEGLSDEFPSGFIVRPAVGVAPQERGHGLFSDEDAFMAELLRPQSSLFQNEHSRRPVKSHILDKVASGESVVLQENVVAEAALKKPLKNKFFRELRLHTYEDSIVEGAVPMRWVQKDLLREDEVTHAEQFVKELLAKLSPQILNRQAWGVDVAIMDNGEMRVIDIVTNRGKRIQWSSYLEQPRVIGAYSRLFEEKCGLHFDGWTGILIRHDLANYFPYWHKRIELSRPGLTRALAYLPPLP